ncbi:MAG: hypothetical protein NTZ54_04475 [Alphaproteobacteria bacterium]|nr:hypothetical protein [Alphaproteobacteria bacterium]
MERLDGWAVAMGETACRYLSRNDHDTIYQALCYDGSASAGWKLFICVLVLVAAGAGLWRLLQNA